MNLDLKTDRNLIVSIQHAYLDVFGARLDDLEKTFDRQFNRLILCHIIFMVLLQELPYSFG